MLILEAKKEELRHLKQQLEKVQAKIQQSRKLQPARVEQLQVNSLFLSPLFRSYCYDHLLTKIIIDSLFCF